MDEPTFTPEQLQAIKRANAHGFVDCLTIQGAPKKNEKGNIVKSASGEIQREPVTPEQAVALYQKAAAFNAAFQGQVDQVKTTVREQAKALAAAA